MNRIRLELFHSLRNQPMLRSPIYIRSGLVMAFAAAIACTDAYPTPYGEYPNFAALDSAFQERGSLVTLAKVLRPNGWSIGVYDGGGSRWCGQTFFHRALRKQIYATVYCAGGDQISFLSETTISEAELLAQVEDTTHWWLKSEPTVSNQNLP